MDLNLRARALLDHFNSGATGISASIFDTAWMSLVTRPGTEPEEGRWLFPDCFQNILSSQREDGSWSGRGSQQDQILNTAASLIALTYHTDQYLTSRRIRARKALQKLLDEPRASEAEEPYHATQIEDLLSILRVLRVPLQTSWNPPSEERQRIATSALQMGYTDQDSLGIRYPHAGFSPGMVAADVVFSAEVNDPRVEFLLTIHEISDRGYVPALHPGEAFERSNIAHALSIGDFDSSRNMSMLLEKAVHCAKAKPTLDQRRDSVLEEDCQLNNLLAIQVNGYEIPQDRVTVLDDGFNPCQTLRILLNLDDPKPYHNRISNLVLKICEEWWAVHGTTFKSSNNSAYYAAMLMSHALVDLVSAWSTKQISDTLSSVIRDQVFPTLFQCIFTVVRLQNDDGSWGDKNSAEESAYALLTVSVMADLPFVQPLRQRIDRCCEQGRVFLSKAFIRSDHKAPSNLWKAHVSFSSSLVSEAYVLSALKTQPKPFGPECRLPSLISIPYDRLPKLEAFYASLPMFKDAPRERIRASLIEGYLFWPTLRSSKYYLYEDKDSSKWLEYLAFVFPACNNVHEVFAPTDMLVSLMGVMSGLYQIDSFLEHAIENDLARNVEELFVIIGEVFDRPTEATRESNEASMIQRAKDSIESRLANGTPDRTSVVSIEDTLVTHYGLQSPPESPHSASKKPFNRFKDNTSNHLDKARRILKKLVTHITQHPAVLKASPHDRHWLWTELRAFFYAQAKQIEEVELFARQKHTRATDASNSGRRPSLSPVAGKNHVFESPYSTYHRWLHTTGADSVGSPYQFAFFSILLAASTSSSSPSSSSSMSSSRLKTGMDGADGHHADCWPSPREKMLVQSMSAGVARMWRIENDVGGLVRDRADGTVNSVNFPEYAVTTNTPHGAGDGSGQDKADAVDVADADDALAAQLVEMAARERRLWQADYAELAEIAKGIGSAQEERVRLTRLFTAAMELYGQIYIARDVWWRKADD